MTGPARSAPAAGWRERLVRQWQSPGALSRALLPLSGLMAVLVGLRRLCYRTGVCRAVRLPVPVVVVGNITVGGTGKTPLTLRLAEHLRAAGYRPGIISRGYGGSAGAPTPVAPGSPPALVGDEPLLLARRAGCPVWVCRDRAAAGRALLARHPEVDVLLCDDGLQHYRLARDLEIAVVDGQRGFGNGHLLPAGPLREPVSRLRRVAAVVVNGGDAARIAPGAWPMRLAGERFHRVDAPEVTAAAADFRGRNVHAVAGIGHPQRFFSALDQLGIAHVGHPFPDHHAFTREEISALDAEVVLMTEKDQVKCRDFGLSHCWALRVDAAVDPGFLDDVLLRLNAIAADGDAARGP